MFYSGVFHTPTEEQNMLQKTISSTGKKKCPNKETSLNGEDFPR